MLLFKSVLAASVTAIVCLSSAVTLSPSPTAPGSIETARLGGEPPGATWVVSPWGYGGWYHLVQGRNDLVCTGTQNSFVHYY